MGENILQNYFLDYLELVKSPLFLVFSSLLLAIFFNSLYHVFRIIRFSDGNKSLGKVVRNLTLSFIIYFMCLLLEIPFPPLYVIENLTNNNSELIEGLT